MMQLLPAIGSLVSLRVKSPCWWTFPQVEEFQGRVVRNPPWLEAGNLCITGDVRMPVRIIRIADIVDIGGVKLDQIATTKTLPRKFRVETFKGTVHFVTLTNGVTYGCDCVGASQFGKTCRHIRAVQNHLGGDENV